MLFRSLKGLIKKLTFIALGQVPVDRAGGSRSEAALLTGLSVLSQGECLGIYPEGTRSPDGRLYRGRTGVARLAMESGAPVVPVAMFHTAEIQPTGKVIPRIKRVKMVFGEPMYFEAKDAKSPEELRKATDKIMETLQELSGQEYVDIYASQAKEAMAEAKRDERRSRKSSEDEE